VSPSRHVPAGRQPALRRRLLVDEVRDTLAQELILNGAVAPGELLPSESELAARYDVSRVTLRQSMRSLQDAGLISSRQGVGWMVLPGAQTLQPRLEVLHSLESFAREAGTQLESVDVEWQETTAQAEESRRLQIPVGDPILVVRRVKLLSGTRVAWLIDVIPVGGVAFDVMREEFAGSVLDILLTHQEIGLEYADTEIRAVNLPADIAGRLGVPAGGAALYTDALARAANGTIIEWAQGWLLPEHFTFHVRRRRHVGQ